MIISADGKFLMTSLFQCRHYDIPGGVEEIESIAFWYITRLKSISFPTTLRKIGDNSFSNLPKIEEIRLPEGFAIMCMSVFLRL